MAIMAGRGGRSDGVAAAGAGRGLDAFYTDLQDEFHRITVVAMSEFGRRVKENASQGAD
ncbi:MAG TPA: DUF1501 domain-containing protein, partial [Anaerolineae bacterium]|nr:DUF1501 domain-containing protein [Anaerolineae bacterium]